MISSLPHSQAAVRRIIALAVLILAVVLAGGGALMAYAAMSADRAQLAEERELMTRRLDSALGRLGGQVTAISVWDEGYQKLGDVIDADWADSHVGRFYADNRGHEMTLVLNGRDETAYAWRGRDHFSGAELDAFRRAAAPLIAEIREQEAVDRRLTHEAVKVGANAALVQTGIVIASGQPYLVAASLIVPGDRPAPRRAEPANILVGAQRLDTPLLNFMQDDLRMAGLHIELSGGRTEGAEIPLVDVNGFVAGHVAWIPKRPGLDVFKHAAPAFAIAFLIVLVAGLALAARIGAILRELAAGDGALDRTMSELVRARDQADAASIAKSQFLANMSHEIRTPLNGILGMAQVMAREDLSRAQEDRLNVIRDSGQTLLAVLNDVLDISKIEAGRMEIDNHEFDLEEAMDAACAAFSSLAAQKDVDLRVDIDPEAQGVWWGDGVRLRQVIANLVSNAVKFTADGDVVVEVAPCAFGLRFTVRDSGIGIPAERLSDLFQKFSQVDASTTRRFGGTGLGLAISRELVELMGGRMAVTSEAGQGSTFTFDLPLEKRGPRRAPTRATEAAPSSGEGPTARILAAEDNATNQVILKSLLEPMGVDLTLVGNGREAVNAFRAGGFDLILMDVQMPEMNGVEAALAIRALEREGALTTIPILALSANVMSHQVAEYLAAGMTGFVPKPIEAGKLFAAIEEALAAIDAGADLETEAA
jgi:signal transduction histidine kinase/sensor domain CHASE-containing protein/AmiR/NasT family two-component response regulator